MRHHDQDKKLEALVSQISQARELDDLQSIIEALRDYFEVDHLVYHWVNAGGEQYGFGTYSHAWVERYLYKGYQRTDPVVVGCFQRFHPVDWKLLDWSSKALREFQKEAISYGVGNQGYSIPIRGPLGQFALFTASHNCDDADWQKFTERNRKNLILLAHDFNRRALEFEASRLPDTSQSLSPREIETLTLLGLGYSRTQVAATLAISENTLRVYIESARFKLGAMNTTHAVARALNLGFIAI